MNSEAFIRGLLKKADIEINGSRPFDMRVYDPRLYSRVIKEGTLGLGEAYMEGWWDASALDQFFARVIGARLGRYIWFNPVAIGEYIRSRILNAGKKENAFVIGEQHYDLGNDFFEKMLDPRMVYTCAYFKDGVADLNIAQEAKLDLVCKKLGLKKGDKVLDIGCGWGSFAKFAAEKYGAEVTGVTVSKEQAELARERVKGLPVEIRLEDYRDTQGQFDHIVSLGMFEHVEFKNHRAYFEVASRVLKPEGLFLLHTIGKYGHGGPTDPWIKKYIFPVGIIPTPKQIEKGMGGYFKALDWHKFGGSHYDRTLMAWHENFARHWLEMKEKYGGLFRGQFERMWRYYLLSCAGAFRSGSLDLWQIVLSKEDREYEEVR